MSHGYSGHPTNNNFLKVICALFNSRQTLQLLLLHKHWCPQFALSLFIPSKAPQMPPSCYEVNL
jgi:hypothetical protein